MGSLQDSYDLGDVIGRGKFGVIRSAIAKNTGESFACKVINKELMVTDAVSAEQRVATARACLALLQLTTHALPPLALSTVTQDVRELRSEIKILRRVTRYMNHPNVAKLFQACVTSLMMM